MRTFDIDEILERFDDLVEEAANGDPFILSANGVPKVRFEPVDALESTQPETAE